MVQNRKKHRKNSHLIIHFPTSEGVSATERLREGVSKRSRACELSKQGRARELVIGASERANKQMDEGMAQYFCLGFWLIWSTV